MRRVVFAIFAVCCVAASSSAFAACGGGGWKNSAPKQVTEQSSSTVVTAAATAPSESEPDYDRYFDSPRSKALDTTHFDSVASKLELSKEQSEKIDAAKQSIRKEVHTLNVTKFNSDRSFDKCNGECENERQAMRKAGAAAQQYSADAEFDKQLRTILNPKQIATYEGKDAAASSGK